MQLEEKIRKSNNLSEAFSSEAHARKLAVKTPIPAGEKQVRGCTALAAESRRAEVVLLQLGFGEGLDPGCEVVEFGGQEAEYGHGYALVVRGEGHERVDAPTAAGVRVWDPEDVGGGVAGEGIAEEDGTARRGGC